MSTPVLAENIHTSAVASVGGQGKARLADTLEAAVLVDAHSVETHVGRGTLIVVLTDRWKESERVLTNFDVKNIL